MMEAFFLLVYFDYAVRFLIVCDLLYLIMYR